MFKRVVMVNVLVFSALVLAIGGSSCPTTLPTPGDPAAYTSADRVTGGLLYDKWWKAAGLAEPTGNHPLWASRPDTTSNTRTGPDTWRCKECHGWDYKGVSGAYGTGSHKTGVAGIFGTTKTAQELFDLIKTHHSYGTAGLSDTNIWDLAKSKIRGHINYYGYKINATKIHHFHSEAVKSLYKWLNRRSQKRSYNWAGFKERLKHFPLMVPLNKTKLKELGWNPYV